MKSAWAVAIVMLSVPAWAGPVKESDEELRHRADELAWKGDIDAAVPLYKQLLTKAPDDDSTILALANALSWSKRREDQLASLPYFDRHLDAHRDDLEARLQRARVRSWVGQIAGAERDYRVVLRAKPGDDLELELAKALSWSKDSADLGKSLALYDRLVGKRPNDLDLRLERGRVRSWKGDAQGAREDFDAWLKKHPDDTAVRLDRARALLWGGDYSPAESALGDLSSLPATRDAADLELARLYAQTNRRSLAIDVLDDLLSRSPGDKEARAERDKLAVGDHVAMRPSLFTFGDSSGNILTSARIDASFPITRGFRVVADVAGWTLTTSQETLLATRGDLGAWLRIPRVMELEAAVGPRVYQYYSPKIGARALARAQPTSWLSLNAGWTYDDLYADMYQPASVDVGLEGHLIHAEGELSLPLHIQVSGRVAARFVDPSNDDLEASATATIRVYKPISIGYAVEWLGWKYNDPAYWSPQGYAAHLFVLRVADDIGGKFSFDVQGQVGAAAERIEGIPDTGFGPAWGASGAATYVASPHLTAGLSVQYGFTQRRVFVATAGGTSLTNATTFDVVSSTYNWMTATVFMNVHF